MEELADNEQLPHEPITGTHEDETDAVSYALLWAPNAETAIGESYVNLIPTTEGGTHVNGLRAGRRAGGARILRIPQPRAARRQARRPRTSGTRPTTCCR